MGTIFSRGDHFLVTESKSKNGYAALLSKGEIANASVPTVCNIQCLGELNEGDIVQIEPNGMVNVLYEAQSPHNVLMLTERCNSSCIMCPQPKVAAEQDKTPLNLKLISWMDKKTRSLGLTGGEPTLLGDKLVDILLACKKTLPKTALNLLTNAIRFEDLAYAQKIAAIGHPDLMIDVPLYGATDTEHNEIVGSNSFYKTIRGLYNLAFFRQKIGIRVVIHKANYKRLPQLAEFIYRNFPFVFHIAFMQMEPTGLARKNIEQLWIDPYDYNAELKEAVDSLFDRNMNVSIYNTQLCVLPVSLRKFAKQSISSWKNIYIDECSDCAVRQQCAGFFESSRDLHSTHIKATGADHRAVACLSQKT